MSNLIRNPFGGVLYPISPRRSGVLGIMAYPSLAAVPGSVELAIVATPAPTVPDILAECLSAGVKAAIVLSEGFGETGEGGSDLERQVREHVRHGTMRVLGTNTLGIACPRTGLNATFAPGMVPPGNVGFLSQSGALLTALLSKDHAAGVGCSAFVSVGSLVDISWAEWIDYLAADPQTECIGIFMEQLDNARAFFGAARQVAPRKPLILLKGGESAAPHSQEAMADDIFTEACRCSGVLRVHRLADLFRMAAHLTSRPLATGRRLTILTNGRGPAIVAADALRSTGGRLAVLAHKTLLEVSAVLTPRWNKQNPIDVGDDADAMRFARAAVIAARDPNTDALLVLLAPQAAIDPFLAAQGLRDLARASDKPVLACWLWGAADPINLTLLRQAGVSTFYSPEAAVRAFGYLWRHAENLRCLTEIQNALADAEERYKK
jgi:acetyltransferase